MAESFDVIIVDDEESARNILSNLISRFHPDFRVVATCEDLAQAVTKIEKHKPALVFLDIEMPNYAGYEITSFFDKIEFEIIFITAYDHYAVKAFEVAAIDYLLKPIEIDRLNEALMRIKERATVKNLALNYSILKESLNSNTLNNLIVSDIHGQKSIAIDRISCIEANESYSTIKTVQGDQYVMSKNLKHFESLLENNSSFFRSHKSWIININHINSFSFTEMTIQLNNQVTAKLSKYKKQLFVAKLSGKEKNL